MLDKAVDAYIDGRHHRREITPLSARTERNRLRLFVRFVGAEREVSSLRRRHIENWLEDSGKTVAPATLRHRLSDVRGFLRYCVDRGYLKSNPSAGIPMAKQPRQIPRGLTAEQIAAVLAQAQDSRDVLLVLLGCQLGLRVGEMARLQVADVDWRDRSLIVWGKGQRERPLPVTDEAWSALQTYLGECPTAGPLIRSQVSPGKGVTAGHIGRRISALMDDAGVDESAHALRHACAQDLLANGANIREIQTVLGHTDLQATQVYLGRMEIPKLREVMEGRQYRNPVAALSVPDIPG